MKKIKRIISVALAAMLLLGALALYGCNGNEETDGGDKLCIVTTVFPVYDWVRSMLGENAANVELVMMLDDGVDLHNFQTTADDIIKLASADLFIYVGGESDAWVEAAIASAKNEKLITLNLIEAIGEDNLCTHEHEHEHEHEESEAESEDHDHGHDHDHAVDEHIWLSLKNAVKACEAIKAKLCEADAANKSVYETASAGYIAKLTALDERYAQMVESASKKAVVFADRFPFVYLMNDYGIEYHAAFSGCSTETTPSFELRAGLAAKVDELGLGAVLTIEGTSDSMLEFARGVIESTTAKNAKIISVNSMQSVTARDVSDGADYLAIMESNLASFSEAMK